MCQNRMYNVYTDFHNCMPLADGMKFLLMLCTVPLTLERVQKISFFGNRLLAVPFWIVERAREIARKRRNLLQNMAELHECAGKYFTVCNTGLV